MGNTHTLRCIAKSLLNGALINSALVSLQAITYKASEAIGVRACSVQTNKTSSLNNPPHHLLQVRFATNLPPAKWLQLALLVDYLLAY
jgi:hypothetical protein